MEQMERGANIGGDPEPDGAGVKGGSAGLTDEP
jgi:hypothetical protein